MISFILPLNSTMSGLSLVSRLARPRLRASCARLYLSAQPVHAKLFSSGKSLLTQLPNTHIFRAIKDHDPASLAAVHSLSGRSFTYGNLTADVLRAKEDLEKKAGRMGKLSGERIAFMAENSYDYVGAYYFYLFFPWLCFVRVEANWC
jgi:hypothetical protein